MIRFIAAVAAFSISSSALAQPHVEAAQVREGLAQAHRDLATIENEKDPHVRAAKLDDLDRKLLQLSIKTSELRVGCQLAYQRQRYFALALTVPNPWYRTMVLLDAPAVYGRAKVIAECRELFPELLPDSDLITIAAPTEDPPF